MPFIAPIIGAIAGVITAAGSFVAGIVGIAGLGKALVAIGLNVAVSVIQAIRNGKQKVTPGGVKFDRQYGADVSRQVACGLVGIAGHDCYINTYSHSNKNLQQIFTVSDYYTDGLSRVAINGKWVTLGDTPDPEKGYPVTAGGDFRNRIWIKFFDGRQTTADDFLIDKANPSTRWTADHIGIGQSFVLVSMTYHQEKNNTFPDFFFEFRGAPLYDWRKDSTVGGSGSHRLNDVSTHEFSDNPIVIEYNYRHGFKINDDLFCGMNIPSNDLPLAKWTAAANICDETVSGEPRYRCSIMLDCMAEHGENISSIQRSCGGMIVDSIDGSWPLVGHDQLIAMTITDDDLVSGMPVKYQERRSMADLVNSISGNYPEPSELWSMIGYEPQISASHIAVDRRTRDLNLDFTQVRSRRQASQLAAIYLYENRYEATATIVLRPRCQVLEPGDWIEWQSDMYGIKTYMITDVNLISLNDPENPRCVQVSLQERDGSIYDGVTPPPIVVPTPPGEPLYINEVQDFTLANVTVTGADGRLLPALRAGWSSATNEDETITGVEVRWFPTDDPTSIFHKVALRGETVSLLQEGIIGATEYRVQTRIMTDPPRETLWTAGEVITTDATPTDTDVYLANVKGDADNLLKSMRRELRELWERVEDISQGTTESIGQSTDLHTVSRRFQNATAVALRTMSASIEEIDGELVAMADIVDAVAVAVGNVSANGLRKIEVVAGSGDVVARLVDMVRATIDDDWVEAGTVTEVGFTGGDPGQPFSRIVQYADQHVFADPNGTFPPFVIETGTAWFNNARIKDLDATNITADKLDAVEILQDGTLITELFSFGAVTEYDELPYRLDTNDPINEGNWTTKATMVVDANDNATPMLEFIRIYIEGSIGGNGGIDLFLRVFRDGLAAENLVTQARKQSSGGSPTIVSVSNFRKDGDTAHTYYIQTWNTLLGSNSQRCTIECDVDVLRWKA